MLDCFYESADLCDSFAHGFARSCVSKRARSFSRSLTTRVPLTNDVGALCWRSRPTTSGMRSEPAQSLYRYLPVFRPRHGRRSHHSRGFEPLIVAPSDARRHSPAIIISIRVQCPGEFSDDTNLHNCGGTGWVKVLRDGIEGVSDATALRRRVPIVFSRERRSPSLCPL